MLKAIGLSAVLVGLLAGVAVGAESKPCDVRLGEAVLYERILEKARLDSERAVAAERLKVLQLEAELKQVRKELDEAKKPTEAKP